MTKNSEIQGKEIILSVEDVEVQDIQPHKRGRIMSSFTHSLDQNNVSKDVKSIEKDETMSVETLEPDNDRKTE